MRAKEGGMDFRSPLPTPITTRYELGLVTTKMNRREYFLRTIKVRKFKNMDSALEINEVLHPGTETRGIR